MAEPALAPNALVLRRRSSGAPLALDPALEIGVGGEARVLGLPDDASLVAKLYHDPTLARARKVALMMDAPPALPAGAAIAWPSDLLTDLGGGRFAGFLMPRAEGPRIFEFYNPVSRRRTAPFFDYGMLHRAGVNLAAAFDALHAAGYVVGDVNESNILVSPGDGAVTLVDADSFQVRDGVGRVVHRSAVGKAEFTPPELQGTRFGDVDRTPEADRFGLSVLVFLLLMEGTHPFASRLGDGGEVPPVEERISRGLFPHARGDDGCRPPRMAPPFYTLDPELQRLFLRAFVDGHADPSARPAPAEWRRALLDAQARLARCAANPRHLFSPHLDLCCWCHRARLLQGRDPFPATEMAAARFAAAPPVPRPRPAPGQLAHAHPYAPAPVPPQPFAPAAPAPPPLVFRATRAALSRAHAALPAWARPAFGPASLGNPLVWMPPAALTCLFGATGGLRLMGLVVFFLALRRVFSGGLPRLRFATVVWAALLLLAWSAVGGAAFAGMFPSKAPAPGVVPVVDDRPADDPVADARVSAALSPAAPGEVGTGDVAPRDVELLNSGDVAQEARSVYPPDLLAHDVSGEVRLRLLVRADGTVDARSVYVLSASDPAFTEPGRIVAGAMRFSPVTVSGRPIPAWVETTLRFTP